MLRVEEDAAQVHCHDVIPLVGSRLDHGALVFDGLSFSFTIDPRTCIGKLSGTQSIAVVGGTGRFAHARGSFAGVLAASGIAPRNVDGTCDVQSLPLFEVDHVSGTGNLSF